MYKVVETFGDLQDNNHQYEVGDEFPHEHCGYPVSEERIAELAGSTNKTKTAEQAINNNNLNNSMERPPFF